VKILRILICALLLTALNSSSFAWIHSIGGVVGNHQRVTVNADPSGTQYLNLAKGMPWFVSNANCSSAPCADSNGYPNQKPTSSITANASFPAAYYGTITWSWSGTGSMQDNTGNPAIFTSISPSGAVFEMGAVSSGDHAPHTYCFCT
jgi:hypothetical protein